MKSLKEKFFNVTMIMMVAVNAAQFVVALDDRMDFLTWDGYRGWCMLGNSILSLATWLPLAYAAIIVIKKIRERRIVKKIDRRNYKMMMSLM